MTLLKGVALQNFVCTVATTKSLSAFKNTSTTTVITYHLTYFKVKRYGIDGDNCFPGKVLKCAGEKSLREKESRDPEYRWNTMVNPLLNELHSVNKIDDPGCQWL